MTERPTRPPSGPRRPRNPAARPAADKGRGGKDFAGGAARPDRGNRPERANRSDRSVITGWEDKPAKSDKFAKTDRPDRGERPARTDKFNKAGQHERPGPFSKNGERGPRAQGSNAERPVRSDRPDRADRPARSGPADRSAASGKSSMPQRAPATGSGASTGSHQSRSPDRSGQDRYGKSSDAPVVRLGRSGSRLAAAALRTRNPGLTPTARAVSSPRGDGEGQRIAKLLARAGIASRREIERMIDEGRVARDGVVIDTPATILTSLHGITVDGVMVKQPPPARLFLFHKPSGVLTAERDPKGRRTIYDAFPKDLPADFPRVMPVGRLDLNTEGLLLLTTDGEFKRQLELPSTGVTRTYRARAYGNVTQEQLEDLMMGVEIEGVRYGPINANMERRTGANAWIEMTLTEGKNREVRRVLEYLGMSVSRLIRTAYGPFGLEDLPVGQIVEVRRHDLVVFRKTLEKKPVSKPAGDSPE